MIRINYWKPVVQEANIGHVSLTIGLGQPDAEYASWWPGPTTGLEFLGNMTFGGPAEIVSYKEDVSREGGEPGQTCLIDGLNEKAIRATWAYYKQNLRYSFLLDNCATTVAFLLHAGGGGLSFVTGVQFYTSYAWTPAEVYLFGMNINANIEGIKKRIAAGDTPPHPVVAEHAVNRKSRLASMMAKQTVSLPVIRRPTTP